MASIKTIKDEFKKSIDAHGDQGSMELRRIFSEALREWELDRGWEESQKGESWTDAQLRVVLSDAPTKDNCLKHARAFGRGYGSIEQIYRWAATADAKKKRPGDAFIAQIKRVARQIGWRA